MVARKETSGTWTADFYQDKKRIRKKGFATKSAAIRYESDMLQEPTKANLKEDSLMDLVHLWQKLHGSTLKDAKYRYARTQAIVERLGSPSASEFNSLAWAYYRTERLKSVTPQTINHEQRYLSAVFSELIRLGAWHGENPISSIRQIKTDQTELQFLSLEYVKKLLDECQKSTNNHAYPVALLCLATGARWDEAESLPRHAVYGGKVHYHKTKNGLSRSVPISPEVESIVLASGLPSGRLFMSCRSAFRSAYERCGFDTPRQLTHILRHTFASHFMMAGGDILTLQRILGHSSIQVTMRYAHLSPTHLMAAVRFSPLSQLALLV